MAGLYTSEKEEKLIDFRLSERRIQQKCSNLTHLIWFTYYMDELEEEKIDILE